MTDQAMAKGYAFISAGYSFLPQSTAFDMIDDVKALFSYIVAPDGLPFVLPLQNSISTSQIAVFGQSAGGYLARLAAVHAEPKPCALGIMWGMVGRSTSTTSLAHRTGKGNAPDRSLAATQHSSSLFSIPHFTNATQFDEGLDGRRRLSRFSRQAEDLY